MGLMVARPGRARIRPARGDNAQMSAQEEWARALAGWALPPEILDRAPESPWTLPPPAFAAMAVRALSSPLTPTHQRVLEALPAQGTLLDVGAGAGAASLPLASRAGLIVAVDQSQEMLDRMAELARGRVRLQAVKGVWPEAAARVRPADVVVCANVAYNVPELGAFVQALTARARRRVVLELTTRHPQEPLNWLWERFWRLPRPVRPTAEDAAAVVREAVGGPVAEARWQRANHSSSPPDPEEVAWLRRRLCLDPSRDAEVAAALAQRPGEGADREMATFWWEGQAAEGSSPP